MNTEPDGDKTDGESPDSNLEIKYLEWFGGMKRIHYYVRKDDCLIHRLYSLTLSPTIIE